MRRIGRSRGSVTALRNVQIERDEIVAKVDDVEGQQPRHDRHRDDDVAVEVENAEDQVQEGVHGGSREARAAASDQARAHVDAAGVRRNPTAIVAPFPGMATVRHTSASVAGTPQ